MLARIRDLRTVVLQIQNYSQGLCLGHPGVARAGSKGFFRVLSSNLVLPVALLDAIYAESIAETSRVIKSTNYPLLFSSFSFPSFSPANFDRSHATWALGVLGAAHMHGNPIALRPHTAARYACPKKYFSKVEINWDCVLWPIASHSRSVHWPGVYL